MKPLDPLEVMDVITNLRDPFNTCMDREVCDMKGRVLKSGGLPILRLRGGEFGKLRSSIDFERRVYIGDEAKGGYERKKRDKNKSLFRYSRNSEGITVCAFNLAEAIGYSIRRSSTASEGGRYNPVTGEFMDQYRFGFPFLIAIDIRAHIARGGISFSQGQPGEIHLTDPVSLDDMVVLFGYIPDERDPLNKTKFIDFLSLIKPGNPNLDYVNLQRRQFDARQEDIVVPDPELIKVD